MKNICFSVDSLTKEMTYLKSTMVIYENSSLGLRKEGRRVMLQFDHSLFGTRPSLLSLYVLLKVIDTCLLVDRSDCKRKVEDPALLK